MANRLTQIWSSGGTAVNGWLAIPSGFSAEVMAEAGWDSVTVDLQHGVQDYASMVACFQGMQASPVLPMARVPWNEPGIVGKALDAGAGGVICPMVNDAVAAAAFVRACRYPPAGQRSNGPIRAGLRSSRTSYQEGANEDVLCIPMIETAQALDELGAILDVPGIDAVYIGPSDLGFSMGLPPVLDREEPELLDAFARVVHEAGRRGVVPGIHCNSAAYARRAIGMGFRLVTIGSDSSLMADAARSAVQSVRGGVAAP